MVTLLCGIALKFASVFTDVPALGATDWLALVLVVLPALFVVVPVPDPLPAWVLLVVPVFWAAEVVWLVVPLGLMVTLLCGIALNSALVLTDVLALGATDWVAPVPVLLVAVLPVWARARPLEAAKATVARMLSLVLIICVSEVDAKISVCVCAAKRQWRAIASDGVLLRPLPSLIGLANTTHHRR
ncbi:hypothetical protein FN976_15185 [Caenimonas sedimenti]|uniref:Uncharacterized protein n=1 Tax=Caenimonas sedimenti TaxID=2596921 RepID=A0A562ZPN4_9BURK|nr:hypothetical protein [Caenimonas sedimenti]TWO70331.1 hypothetical protein FN976_15185 [Caenimonas sedimenti]